MAKPNPEGEEEEEESLRRSKVVGYSNMGTLEETWSRLFDCISVSLSATSLARHKPGQAHSFCPASEGSILPKQSAETN